MAKVVGETAPYILVNIEFVGNVDGERAELEGRREVLEDGEQEADGVDFGEAVRLLPHFQISRQVNHHLGAVEDEESPQGEL